MYENGDSVWVQWDMSSTIHFKTLGTSATPAIPPLTYSTLAMPVAYFVYLNWIALQHVQKHVPQFNHAVAAELSDEAGTNITAAAWEEMRGNLQFEVHGGYVFLASFLVMWGGLCVTLASMSLYMMGYIAFFQGSYEMVDSETGDRRVMWWMSEQLLPAYTSQDQREQLRFWRKVPTTLSQTLIFGSQIVCVAAFAWIVLYATCFMWRSRLREEPTLPRHAANLLRDVLMEEWTLEEMLASIFNLIAVLVAAILSDIFR